MQKSTLALYMQKVAEGDSSFAGRLCAQLADRLLYIPTKAQAKTGAAVKVSIVRLFENGSYVVPVFTSEKKLRDWSMQSGRNVDLISLLGADFCSALDGETSLSVDPGSDPTVTLGPNFVREISMSGGSGDYGEIARSATEMVKEVAAPPPAPAAVSSMAQFPGNSAPPPQPNPMPRAVRKEEFPPFVPPSAQSAEAPQRTPRSVEQRELPIGETVRAPRPSLAAGALMGSDNEELKPRRDAVDTPVSAASPESAATDPSIQKKKKGLFGLFSKK